jgi:hypothetical protein
VQLLNAISAIMISRCKLSFENVQQGLISLDERITIEQVTTLLRFLPTPSEVDQLLEYDGDIELLARPDRFVLTLIVC